MITHETQQALYQMHTANALSIIANGLIAMGGKSLDYPMYTDLIGMDKPQTDTRSAEEIKNDVLKHLMG